MAADLLGRGVPLSSVPELQDEAVRLGGPDRRARHLHRWPTAASSAIPAKRWKALPPSKTTRNGRRSSMRARRESADRGVTAPPVKFEMLYVAVPVNHPAIGFVRVALPLTDVRDQLQTVLTATMTALGVALLGGTAIAWLFSARISKRVRLIAGIAERYRRGDLTPPHLGFGDDELGTVARALDDPCRKSDGGSASRRAIARGWKRSSPAWSKGSSSSIRRDGCSS
jgi:hypothetical protein